MARAAIVIVITSVLIVLASFAGQPPNLEKALDVQRQLIDQQPYDSQARNDLGNLLLVAGRFAEAEQAYRRAVELDPRSTAALFNLALLLQQSGREQEAMTELQGLLEVDEYHGWGHYQLGVLLDQQGDRSKAVGHYARAFAYDPNLTFAENNPHIIDNRLTTEALLLAQRYRRPQASGVPRLYSNPDRIVDLMLEEPQAEEGDAAAAEDSGMPAADGAGARLPSGAAGGSGSDLRVESDQSEEAEEDDEGDGESERRVLTPASVAESGSRNQASGGGPSPGSSRPDSREALREAFEERFRAARERAQTSQPADRSSDGRSSTNRSSAGSANPPGRSPSAVRRPRYIPGRASTGRLQLEIRPSSPGEPAESALAAQLDAVDEDRRRPDHPAAHG